jgi:hypothetical protein
MIKAKLIESHTYYRARRMLLILMFLPAIPAAIVINYLGFPTWTVVLAVIAYVAILYVGIKNSKRMTAMSKARMLEIDEQVLRVTGNGSQQEMSIHLQDVDSIRVSKDLGIPQESFKDISNELGGTMKENYLIIRQKAQAEDLRFDFVVESYYMVKKLEDLIAAWKTKGYLVERV